MEHTVLDSAEKTLPSSMALALRQLFVEMNCLSPSSPTSSGSQGRPLLVLMSLNVFLNPTVGRTSAMRSKPAWFALIPELEGGWDGNGATMFAISILLLHLAETCQPLAHFGAPLEEPLSWFSNVPPFPDCSFTSRGCAWVSLIKHFSALMKIHMIINQAC